MRYVLVTLLIGLCAVKGMTQSAWKLEPTSFLGVKFGEPLSSSYLECSISMERGKRMYPPGAGVTCWERNGDDAVLIRPGKLFKIDIQSIDAKVASISASFRQSEFSEISQEFIAEYGEPQWRNHPPIQMKGGGIRPSDGLNWFGRDIDFFCSSQSPVEGEGMLGMNNGAWSRLLERIARE